MQTIYERLERHNQRAGENVAITLIREREGRLELMTSSRDRKALQIDLQALCDQAASICRQCGEPAPADRREGRRSGLCAEHEESR